MTRELQPALHDIGKLLDTATLSIGGHNFKDTAWLVNHGIALPETTTWEGITGHHDTPLTADVFLLILADHAASAASRAYDDEDKKTVEHPITTTKTVHKLWRPHDSHSLKRITKIDELREFFDFLRGDPLDQAYLEKYTDLLHQRPEDLRKPNDVASLYTHSRLVAKLYSFFKRYTTVLNQSASELKLAFGGRQANTPNHAQNEWEVWLTLGEVYFPQEPARARDLNVFNRLDAVMRHLARQDQVLFCASSQFLAILPPAWGDDATAALRELLQPVLAAGFYAHLKQARVFLERENADWPSMYDNPLPETLREQTRPLVEERVQRAIAKIKDPKTKKRVRAERHQQFTTEFENRFPHSAQYSTLPEKFGASICEICQMEEGAMDWPRDYVLDIKGERLCDRCRPIVEDAVWPPDSALLCPQCLALLGDWLEGRTGREVLGPNCYALRREGVRLKKLDTWTDRPQEQVAWVRVVLNLPQLIKSLETLYSDYVQQVAPDLLTSENKPALRMSVVAEFQWDYEEFLRRFNAALIDHFGVDNVEQVFGTDTSDLLCVRLNSPRELLCILKLYQDLVCHAPAGRGNRNKFFCRHAAHRRHVQPFFPAFTALPASPVQLMVTASRAHYPFSQHWRQMERERGHDDVYLHVVGSGEMRISLQALGTVLQKAEYRHRRAFHTLGQIARLSEALARLRMHDRGDRQQWIYRRLRDDLLPLGLDYRSILTLVKIMGG